MSDSLTPAALMGMAETFVATLRSLFMPEPGQANATAPDSTG